MKIFRSVRCADRRGRVALGVFVLAVVGLLFIAVEDMMARGSAFGEVYGREWATERFEELHERGDGAALVREMEQRFDEYEAAVDKLGGWDSEYLGKPFMRRQAPKSGISALFCHMHGYGELLTRYMPSDVEWFLYVAVPADGYHDSRVLRMTDDSWQEVAKLMAESRHPMLKALGLWFRGEFVMYREFVYQKVEEGDRRFLAMAAHAADRYDEDAQRALRHLLDFKAEVLAKEGRYYQMQLLNEVMVKDAFSLIESEQGSSTPEVVSEVLDALLNTTETSEAKQAFELFVKAGRLGDAERYRKRVDRNLEQWKRRNEEARRRYEMRK